MTNIRDIIPAEVLNDDFYNELILLASRQDIKTFLEIGSSSGGGSTQALVDGIKINPNRNDVRLFCMELSRPRFIRLSEAYVSENFVKTYNLSSVSTREFPNTVEVEFFYNNVITNINKATLPTVLEWREQDITYIKDNALDANGIQFIMQANGIDKFDFVLIDGSEFTGERELMHVLGAKIIALDDINAFKCYSAFSILSSHFAYNLISKNMELRNGFAIFERKF